MLVDYRRKTTGSLPAGLAALVAMASMAPDPLDRPRRLYRGHARMSDGTKLLRDGCGRKRYRRRVRINGRKISVVTR